MKIPDQVLRVSIVTAALVVLAAVARFVVIPSSFFASELHRDTTIQRELDRPIRFGGSSLCSECHADVAQVKNDGYHRSLGCESCHGPAADHVDDPTTIKPYAPRDRKFCPVCHTYDPARPTGFPQINPTVHNPLKACITCHNPHDPVPPEVPRECSACHAEIARTKAVSSHALLECSTCHQAPVKHRVQPRSVLPTKPQTRAFCGQCHASDAPSPDAPKVDMTEHGGDYKCWDCHYPHLPEGS